MQREFLSKGKANLRHKTQSMRQKEELCKHVLGLKAQQRAMASRLLHRTRDTQPLVRGRLRHKRPCLPGEALTASGMKIDIPSS